MNGLNRSLRGMCAATLVLVLAGPALGEPKGPPASLREAAAVIDFRHFPLMEHTEMSFQTATKLGYALSKPDMGAALKFHRSKLEEAGWKIESEDVNQEYQFGELVAAKDGFTVSVNVTKDPGSEKRTVSIYNQGNIDARSLPRMPGAEPGHSQYDSAGYRVNADYDTVAKFLRAELPPLGWREFVGYGGRQERIPGETDFLFFTQRGMHVIVMVNLVEGQSEVRYQVGMNAAEMPIMPEAKGDVELMDEPFAYVAYTAGAELPQVLEFYRKELAAQGWTVGAEEAGAEGVVKLALEDPDKKPMRLEVKAMNKVTLVLLASAESGM